MKEKERIEKAFSQSPVGRARAAREAGDRIFQIDLPIERTARTVLSYLSYGAGGGNVATKKQMTSMGQVLEAIEAEGWVLESADFIYKPTGSISRDKLLSSGQTAETTGEIIGIYLFRAVERTPDP